MTKTRNVRDSIFSGCHSLELCSSLIWHQSNCSTRRWCQFVCASLCVCAFVTTIILKQLQISSIHLQDIMPGPPFCRSTIKLVLGVFANCSIFVKRKPHCTDPASSHLRLVSITILFLQPCQESRQHYLPGLIALTHCSTFVIAWL